MGHSPKEEDESASEFADNVRLLLALYHHGDAALLAETAPLKTSEERRIAQVIFYIQELIFSQGPFVDDEERYLNADAQALIEAIAQNKDNPIWKYIKGQKQKHRGTRRPTTPALLNRAIVYAFTRALLLDGSGNAFVEAVDALKAEGISISVKQITGWEANASANGSPIFKQMVDACVAIIEQRAKEGSISRSDYARIWAVMEWKRSRELRVSKISRTPDTQNLN